MEYININSFLLSLVLAFQDLEESLAEEEKSALAIAAKQLSAKPEVWSKEIEPNLLATIEKNSNLSKLFQLYKSQLERVDGKIPNNLLPTSADLELVLNSPQMTKTRPLPRIDLQDLKSKEIDNMVIKVMVSDSPTKTAKKLNFLTPIKNFLNS